MLPDLKDELAYSDIIGHQVLLLVNLWSICLSSLLHNHLIVYFSICITATEEGGEDEGKHTGILSGYFDLIRSETSFLFSNGCSDLKDVTVIVFVEY